MKTCLRHLAIYLVIAIVVSALGGLFIGRMEEVDETKEVRPFIENFMDGLLFAGGFIFIFCGFTAWNGIMTTTTAFGRGGSANPTVDAVQAATVYLNNPEMMKKAHGGQTTRRYFTEENKLWRMADFMLPFVFGAICILISTIFAMNV